MKITRKDLIVEDNEGFSYSDFPYLDSWKTSFDRVAVDVLIGHRCIARIVEDTDGVWHVSDVYSKFKSLGGAINGLLRRLNK